VESGRAKGLLAAHSLTTLHYLLARHTDYLQAATALQDVLRVFSVATVDQDVILQALALGWHDFENAVQMAAASKAGAEYLITRNLKDFKKGPISVLLPTEFLALLRGTQRSE